MGTNGPTPIQAKDPFYWGCFCLFAALSLLLAAWLGLGTALHRGELLGLPEGLQDGLRWLAPPGDAAYLLGGFALMITTVLALVGAWGYWIPNFLATPRRRRRKASLFGLGAILWGVANSTDEEA